MKKLVFLALLLVFAGSACAADTTTGLVGWWKMDDGAGTVVTDYSGNGNNGTLQYGNAWIAGGGIDFSINPVVQPWGDINNRGITFDNAALVADMGLTNQLTISYTVTWTQAEAFPGGNQAHFTYSGTTSDGTNILSSFKNDPQSDFSRNQVGNTGFYLWGTFNENNLNYFIFRNGKTWGDYITITETTDFTTGVYKMYIDGLLYNAAYDPYPNVTGSFADMTAFAIGECIGSEDYRSMQGKMKDFRIYNKALTADEVWFLANPTDLNCDKLVNMRDLQILVYDWLNDSMGNSDINKDGIVNFKDYTILLNNWNEGGKYYFDSADGNDSYTGKSQQQAWQSLNKFNSTTFLPCDRIYFKAGSQWNGSLEPKGSGTAEAVIIIDAYGDISDENNKPRIDGNGDIQTTLSIQNVEYWEINNLQITNLGPTRQASRRAVDIRATDFGTMHHIHLKNLYVHSVNGLISKEDGGGCGISWANVTNNILTKLDGLLIEGCHIKTTDRDGIVGGNTRCGMQTNAWPRDYGNDWYPSVNVIIRGNLLEDIGGDGIVPVGTDGCIVEYNVIKGAACRTYNFSPKQCSAGIWPWSADNTVVQYNEVTGMKGTADGQGFDSDYNTANSLFQYNYSHDNEGGFMLVCDNTSDGIGNIGTVVRYNISQNDQERTFYIGAGIQAYNNVVYNGSGSDLYLMYTVSNNRGQSVFRNNIFMSLGTYRFTYAAMQSSNNAFSNNCWVANSWQKKSWLGTWSSGKPSDPYAITSNPQFINPGSGGNGFDTLDGYKLQSSSPCIGAGTTITSNGGYDFWGNILYNGNPDMGAEEH